MPEEHSQPVAPCLSEFEILPPNEALKRFFQKADWLSFTLASALTFVIYVWTMAPEVTLEMSGIISTAGAYGGVAHPPGFPVWTWYAWFFTKLLPFSNIAWRVSVSSAVAAAVTCGVIALMVSRGAVLVLEGMPGFGRLEQKEERLVRSSAGVVTGMVFGFDGGFWGDAITADTGALAMALFSLAICLLLRWSYSKERRRYLYSAFFTAGLAGGTNPMLVPAALGLPFFVAFVEIEIGRELFFASAVLAGGIVLSSRGGHFPLLDPGSTGTWEFFLCLAVVCCVTWIVMVYKTRRAFTRSHQAIFAGMLTVLALGSYFYLPIASMTNPPSNWGYARTVEGFFHLISRGQFERFSPTGDFERFFIQMRMYLNVTLREFGWFPTAAALIPFLFLKRMVARERRTIFGLAAFFVCTSVLAMILLNPPPDRQAEGMIIIYLTPSHLILALWAGFGLVLFATIYCRPRSEPDPSDSLVIPHR